MTSNSIFRALFRSLLALTLLNNFGCTSSEEANESSLFKLLDPEETGIDFANIVPENDSISQFTYHYLFNGAGVGIGDINNDGLNDVFFASNSTSCRLFLNKGDFKFEDITESSGLITKQWMTGVSMIDVNNDGWLDIYVCASGASTNGLDKANKLFINQKNNTFIDKAKEWGVDDQGNSSCASFFDFDHDGDLDLYVGNHALEFFSDINVPFTKTLKMTQNSAQRFYRNDGNTFTNITKEVGMEAGGYCLSTLAGDFNQDGFIDLYVCNDYHIPDYFYINQGNGTFKDECYQRIKHSSINSMGSDLTDINNDGLLDFITLDMLPESPERYQRLLGSKDYDYVRVSTKNGYQHQYMHNNLQINQGNGYFSEMGFAYNVAKTDWSWSALFSDFDSDGFQDLFVSNGYYRDVTDLDFIMYQNRKEQSKEGKINHEEVLKMLPFEKLKNYIFQGSETAMKNMADEWGLKETSLSSGAAIGDLNNDGQLDLIVCNQGEPAFIYKNQGTADNHFLSIKPKSSKNQPMEGAILWVMNEDQSFRSFPLLSSRGYLSSSEPIFHVGLGKSTNIPEVYLELPNGDFTKLKDLVIDKTTTIDINSLNFNKKTGSPFKSKLQVEDLYFKQVEQTLPFTHSDIETPDYKREPLLPHRYTMLGPGMSSGDVNGDGITDIFIGDGTGKSSLFLGNISGTYTLNAASQPWREIKTDVTASVLFDADSDGDLDLYVAIGGTEISWPSNLYKHRLYINNGKGLFTDATAKLPNVITSSTSVTAADYDRDGDIDLFVSGRILPGNYPNINIRSYLLKNNNGTFVDATNIDASALVSPGMICEAIFTDFNNDLYPDLVLVGEYTPIIFMKNVNGKFEFVSKELQTLNYSGWYNSICPIDIDNDGDLDYIVGNKGQNSFIRATQNEPLFVYWTDFDGNGRSDFFLGYTKNGTQYPLYTIDDMSMVVPKYLNKKYTTYSSFSNQSMEDIFGDKLKENQMFANEFNHLLLINNMGSFSVKPLPFDAQKGPINGLQVLDVNNDGYLDVLISGNNKYTREDHGPDDAHDGGVLLNQQGTGFKYLNGRKSGFKLSGDGRSMVLTENRGKIRAICSQHNDKVKTLESTFNSRIVKLPKCDDAYAILKGGKKRKLSIYQGHGYMSSCTPQAVIDDQVIEISIISNNGKTVQTIRN